MEVALQQRTPLGLPVVIEKDKVLEVVQDMQVIIQLQFRVVSAALPPILSTDKRKKFQIMFFLFCRQHSLQTNGTMSALHPVDFFLYHPQTGLQSHCPSKKIGPDQKVGPDPKIGPNTK